MIGLVNLGVLRATCESLFVGVTLCCTSRQQLCARLGSSAGRAAIESVQWLGWISRQQRTVDATRHIGHQHADRQDFDLDGLSTKPASEPYEFGGNPSVFKDRIYICGELFLLTSFALFRRVQYTEPYLYKILRTFGAEPLHG